MGVDELANLTSKMTIDKKKKAKEQKSVPQIQVKSRKISKRERRKSESCRKAKKQVRFWRPHLINFERVYGKR